MNPLDLYRQATTDVAAFDLSAFGKLVLRGKDSGSFLQNFTTNDVIEPGPGGGCETFVLTAPAKVVAWARVAVGQNELYLHTDPGLVTRLQQHLERHQIGEQLTFEDRTESEGLWHVCGPKAEARLRGLGMVVDDLAPWRHAEFELHGRLGRVQRSDFVGLPGVFVTLPRAAGDSFVRWGGEHALPASHPIDVAWTMLRVEAGTPMGGVDFDESNLPQEVNRTEQAISFTKGCYLGQETVARIRAYGHVNRQLVPVWFPAKTEPNFSEAATWYAAALKYADKEVGRLKTVTYSPRLHGWLAFALLRREHLDVGKILQAVHASGETSEVAVTTWPARVSPPPTSIGLPST